jgi:hypothetical protein
MTKQANGQVDRIESAANITLLISKGANQGDSASDDAGFIEIPISRLDTTKEVEISEIRESSLKASGYSITSISYSGTMMFKGSRLTKTVPNSDGESSTRDVSTFLYDDHGVPVPVSINIEHDLAGESEVYEHVLVTSESYEVRSEESTETAFDWVAMDRSSDQPK